MKGDGAEDLRVRGAGCAAGAADQTGINLEPVPAKVAALTKPLPLGKLYKIGPQGNRDGWDLQGWKFCIFGEPGSEPKKKSRSLKPKI